MLRNIFVGILIVGGGWYFGNMHRGSSQTPEEKMSSLITDLEVAAAEVNKTAPTMVDEATRFDRVAAGPGAKLTYHYSLPSHSSSELDADWFATEMKAETTSQVCAQGPMRMLMSRGTSIGYSYKASDGRNVGRFSIEPEDCGIVVATR